MYKLYILNAFSLNMLNRESQRGAPQFYAPNGNEACHLSVARWPRPVDNPQEILEDVAAFPEHFEIVSAVGHETTAKLFEQILGVPVPYNRMTVQPASGDRALIGQYIGPRLEEGATELPEGARIEWWTL